MTIVIPDWIVAFILTFLIVLPYAALAAYGLLRWRKNTVPLEVAPTSTHDQMEQHKAARKAERRAAHRARMRQGDEFGGAPSFPRDDLRVSPHIEEEIDRIKGLPAIPPDAEPGPFHPKMPDEANDEITDEVAEEFAQKYGGMSVDVIHEDEVELTAEVEIVGDETADRVEIPAVFAGTEPLRVNASSPKALEDWTKETNEVRSELIENGFNNIYLENQPDELDVWTKTEDGVNGEQIVLCVVDADKPELQIRVMTYQGGVESYEAI